MSRGYGQFCPVAKASEVVAERWTPLVLRELIGGSHRFNDLLRGVPLMSRSLLSKRLRELERAGVVERRPSPGGRGPAYHLTPAGEELTPIIIALGEWGQRWARDDLHEDELDPTVLLWDMHRNIAIDRLPAHRVVVQFFFPDAPRVATRRIWLVLDRPEVEVCFKDPGFELDLVVTASLRTLTQAWMGDIPLADVLGSEEVRIEGRRELVEAFPGWLKLSMFAGLERPGPRTTVVPAVRP